MEDFLNNYGLYICIALGALVLILAIILIVKSIKSKNKTEDTSSILDIDIDGVVDGSFDYGYEKEDTIVMTPVENKEETDVNTKVEEKEDNNNEKKE
jgi:hypothetical protein